jgi:hypothetical protein
MTADLSNQLKLLILGGLLLVLAAAGTTFFLFERNHSQSAPLTTSVSTVHTQPATHHRASAVTHPSVAAQLTPGLPAPLRAALVHSKTVVAVVYTPGDPVDAFVLVQALLGAKVEHVKVVVLDVTNDAVAGTTATWMKSVVDPSVLVVNRPGTIAAELDGFADAAAVAQAVVDARH